MARKENISKAANKPQKNEDEEWEEVEEADNDFESGDNPDERENMSRSTKK